MSGRAKPNWAVFVGGPRDGVREVLPPSVGAGPYLVYEPGTAPGMVKAHEYLVTAEHRPGGFHEARSRVVRFVRTVPEEQPAAPPLAASDAARIAG